MRLEQFPEQIAQAQEELLVSEQAFRDWNLHYQALINRIDYEVAFDPELKNEQQRKAVKGERLQQPEYLAALDTLHHLQEKRDRAAIQLELLRNQFKVALLLEQRSSL